MTIPDRSHDDSQHSAPTVAPHGSGLDPILPRDMAKHAEHAGCEKAQQDAIRLLVLGALAGAFIAFGAVFAAAVMAESGANVDGLTLLAAGVAFSLAYVLAIVGGAELFTTNNLMVMAWARGTLTTILLLRAWSIVFVGNFFGAAVTGVTLVLARRHLEADGEVGAYLVGVAEEMVGLTMFDAFLLALLGNMLLSLGVWLSYSGRTTTDRMFALTPPVAAFYVLDLEHVVAVMFYIPTAAVIGFTGELSPDIEALPFSVGNFLQLIGTVALGNIVGGGVLVALTYWFVYLRPITQRHGSHQQRD